MEYELFYLIGASKESDSEKIKKETEKIVTENGGEFKEKTTVEKRRLSYEVKHETHGIYIARRFELEKKEMISEITAKLNLYTDVLRFIISKASDLPELKSKEERMAEAEKKQSNSREKEEITSKTPTNKKEIKKESPKVEEKNKESEKKSKKPTLDTSQSDSDGEEKKEEDIDKKLEEILNI